LRFSCHVFSFFLQKVTQLGSGPGWLEVALGYDPTRKHVQGLVNAAAAVEEMRQQAEAVAAAPEDVLAFDD
jgi:hypothetical protein